MDTNTIDINSKQPEGQVPETCGKILIVEDNLKNRKLVRTLLQFNHFDVLEAEDAEAGIQIAKDCYPDLILMDIQLPGMDGLQATRVIKEIPELGNISVVALTSYAMDGDSQKAKAAGCDGYITKPIDTRKFIDNIRPFLPQTDATIISQTDHSDIPAPKLLIVDDEPLNLKLLRAKLGNVYPNIIDASNGHEALKKANEAVPDLILLDIMMPGLDGFEVTRQLKASPTTKDIPVILITSLDGHDYKVMGFEAGADEFLNKPINTLELLTRVKSLIDMKQYQNLLVSANASGKEVSRSEQFEDYLNFPNQKILVILKDSENRKKIEMYLFGQPYEISLKDDYKKVAEFIHNNYTDILIIDHQLQDDDFLELGRTVKQNENKGNCQILYVTTENDLEQKFSQIEDCVDDFLTQPFNIYELRARIKVLLKKKAFLDRLFNSPATNIQHIITDQLTGLYNFEYCKHVLKHELQRSVRQHCKVSLVMLQVDKQLTSHNSIGHSAGDPFLGELSELIKKSIRKLDIASRRSKRTFTFVLPETDDEKTQGFIQRMMGLFGSQLSAVRSSEQPAERLFIFGYAVCPDDSDQMKDLIKIADAALEKNKDVINNSDKNTDQPVKSRMKKNQTDNG